MEGRENLPYPNRGAYHSGAGGSQMPTGSSSTLILFFKNLHLLFRRRPSTCAATCVVCVSLRKSFLFEDLKGRCQMLCDYCLVVHERGTILYDSRFIFYSSVGFLVFDSSSGRDSSLIWMFDFSHLSHQVRQLNYLLWGVPARENYLDSWWSFPENFD